MPGWRCGQCNQLVYGSAWVHFAGHNCPASTQDDADEGDESTEDEECTSGSTVRNIMPIEPCATVNCHNTATVYVIRATYDELLCHDCGLRMQGRGFKLYRIPTSKRPPPLPGATITDEDVRRAIRSVRMKKKAGLIW